MLRVIDEMPDGVLGFEAIRKLSSEEERGAAVTWAAGTSQ